MESCESNTMYDEDSFDQDRCDRSVAKMVIVDEMPFSCVEGEGFRNLFTCAEPRYEVPDRKKLAALVCNLYLSEKTKIASAIGGQRVSITTAIWKSFYDQDYMVVTAHYMDSDWNLHRRIINFTSITSHEGDEIGKCLEVCLSSWRIKKIFTITHDNVTTDDVAVNYMKRRLGALSTLLLDGQYLHLRSACHVINLIVKDRLEEFFTSIEGIRNVVRFLHQFSAGLAKFREFAILEMNEEVVIVPHDFCTRWNSTYKMLDVACKYKLVFDRMRDEYAAFLDYFQDQLPDDTYRVGPPTDEDWEKAQAFVNFLKMFYDATVKLSAIDTVTSNLIFTEMVKIQLEIEKKMRDAADPVLQRVAISMKTKFDKYWKFEDEKSVNRLVFVANVLDPRWKMQWLEVGFAMMGSNTDKVERLASDIKQCLVKLYDEYKGGDGSGGSQTLNDVQDKAVYDELFDGDDFQKMMARDFIELRKKEQLMEISNEVGNYLNDPVEIPSNEGFKLLDWWKWNQRRYPVLSKIAKDIFAIPSSAVATENAFRLGNRVLDHFRSSFPFAMTEALVCASDWLRPEKISSYEEPVDDDIAFYKELEEPVDDDIAFYTELEEVEASCLQTQSSASH